MSDELLFSTPEHFNPRAPWRDIAQIVTGGGLLSVPETVTKTLFNDEYGIPTDSYLYDAVKHGETRTGGNIAFHLATGLATLAVIAERGLDSTIFPGTGTRSNLWVLIVGPSASAKKTTCMELQTVPLASISPELVISKPGSSQGLTKMLAQRPVCLLTMPEFGDFLAASSKEVGSGFYGQVKEALTKWFDGGSESIPYANETLTIVEPRLSIVGCVAPEFLAEHASPRDWSGGFYSRFLVVYADAERDVELPEETADSLATVNRMRSRLSRWLRVGPEGGREFPIHPPVTVDPEARELWKSWSSVIRHRTTQFKDFPAVNSALGRIGLHTGKVAQLLAMNAGKCENGPWSLGARELACAIRFMDFVHLASAVPLIESCGDSFVTRQKARVMQMLQTKEPRTVGEFSEVLGSLKGTIVPVLDTLIAEGKVYSRTRDGELLYFIKRKQAVVDESVPASVRELMAAMRRQAP